MTSLRIREARIRAAMKAGMTEWEARKLADKLEHRNDLNVAVDLLGDLIDWFGAPDWPGPSLPYDLGKRIADLMKRHHPSDGPVAGGDLLYSARDVEMLIAERTAELVSRAEQADAERDAALHALAALAGGDQP